MDTTFINLLVNAGPIGLFIIYSYYTRGQELEVQSEWRKFHQEQLKIVSETTQNLTALLGDYQRLSQRYETTIKQQADNIAKMEIALQKNTDAMMLLISQSNGSPVHVQR